MQATKLTLEIERCLLKNASCKAAGVCGIRLLQAPPVLATAAGACATALQCCIMEAKSCLERPQLWFRRRSVLKVVATVAIRSRKTKAAAAAAAAPPTPPTTT